VGLEAVQVNRLTVNLGSDATAQPVGEVLAVASAGYKFSSHFVGLPALNCRSLAVGVFQILQSGVTSGNNDVKDLLLTLGGTVSPT